MSAATVKLAGGELVTEPLPLDTTTTMSMFWFVVTLLIVKLVVVTPENVLSFRMLV